MLRIQEEREERHRLKNAVKEQVKQGRPVDPPETQARLGMKNLNDNKCKFIICFYFSFKIQRRLLNDKKLVF